MWFTYLNKIIPVILNVTPHVFNKDDIIAITGKYFGEKAEDSFLKVDSIVIPSTLCHEWNDTKIVLSANILGDGGLLFVIAKNSYSKPVFVSNILDIPIVKIQENIENKPNIEALSKDYGEIGSLIKIYGSNFGTIRENSDVLFIKKDVTSLKEYDRNLIVLLDDKDAKNIIYCSDKDFDFDFWSDEEIHIRIPDGAISGLIAIRTKNGFSNTIPFNIRGSKGNKSFLNEQKFLISVEVEVSNIKTEKENILFLRSPLPEQTNSQSNVKIVSNAPTPLIQNHHEGVIYQFDDIEEEDKILVKQQYNVTTYEIETDINAGNISTKIINQKLHNYYTKETTLLPVNNDRIKRIIKNIVGEELNPYVKAKKIYEYIIANFNIIRETASDRSQTIISMLENKSGSPYDASLLFSTLCRASGVPCIPISGVITDGKNTYLHWWAEFYIYSYGWVPLDIGMAMDIPFASRVENRKSYYFGNLDGDRISFSHGEKDILPMIADGKTYSRERSFGLQTFWEEAINIKSYTCFWHIPQITKTN